MGGNVNNNTTTNNQWNWNFNFNINLGGDQGVDACAALRTLNQSRWLSDSITRGGCHRPQDIAPGGCIPPPSMDQSAPPAGRGLQTGETGWPANTVTTAGGYHVVARGGTVWDIYAPGQNPSDKPNTHVHGDPHVDEKDGTRWDFTGTKGLDGEIGNDFVLGDGTRIFARTSSDQGHSVTTGLEIVNGTDRVSIGGLNGTPQMGQMQQDGYEWRAAHVAQAGDRATFYLAGDKENVHWMRETRGQLEGVITGAKDVKGSYDQIIDPTLRASVGADLRPPVGSRAWGNQLRGQLDDAQANFWGQVGGQAGVVPALQNSFGLHANHIQGEFQSDLREAFGGWLSYFQGVQSPFQALSMLRDLLLSDNQYQRDLRFGMTSGTRWA